MENTRRSIPSHKRAHTSTPLLHVRYIYPYTYTHTHQRTRPVILPFFYYYISLLLLLALSRAYYCYSRAFTKRASQHAADEQTRANKYLSLPRTGGRRARDILFVYHYVSARLPARYRTEHSALAPLSLSLSLRQRAPIVRARIFILFYYFTALGLVPLLLPPSSLSLSLVPSWGPP